MRMGITVSGTLYVLFLSSGFLLSYLIYAYFHSQAQMPHSAKSHCLTILLLKSIFGLHVILTSTLIYYRAMYDFPPYVPTLSY